MKTLQHRTPALLLGITLFALATSAGAVPTVNLTAPKANAAFAAPATVAITATATPSSGTTIKKVDFYRGTTLIASDTTAPYSATWSNAPAGSYSLTAQATDDRGAVGTSVPLSITVGANGVAVYYLHTDHLNTPRLATDEQNQIVWRSQPLTEPFGNNPPEEDPDGNGIPFTLNLRFPGQYFDKETNLNYNYFRDYDPSLGRYVQSDPIGLAGGINTYTYVDGNPLAYIDPLGNSKVQGQSSIGGSDPAVSGVSKSSSPQEIQNAIKEAEKVLKDPNASPARKRFLKGWIKVAKRGFTKSICPPLLEDLVQAMAHQACLNGDTASCKIFVDMGGEIDDPGEI